ncbi:MAG: TRIC cation channel family protein [Clostridia bacterium]|nr:TRIC cation channel family protein [Clostridia bacterium]
MTSIWLRFLEITACIAFASSGVLTAAKMKMDVFGVIVLGVVTTVGGGLIRDIILGIRPPVMFCDYTYVITSVITSFILFIIIYLKKELLNDSRRGLYDTMMLVFDSIGLAIFTVIGINTAMQLGYDDNVLLVVFVGVITGIGGGITRDVFTGNVPYIFVKHIYALASIAGAVVCYYTYKPLGAEVSMTIGSIVIVLIRFAAAYFKWNMPHLDD